LLGGRSSRRLDESKKKQGVAKKGKLGFQKRILFPKLALSGREEEIKSFQGSNKPKRSLVSIHCDSTGLKGELRRETRLATQQKGRTSLRRTYRVKTLSNLTIEILSSQTKGSGSTRQDRGRKRG